MAVRVSNDEISAPGKSEPRGTVQQRRCSGHTVLRVGPGYGGDSAVRYLADSLIAGVDDVEIAGAVHRYAIGTGELSGTGRALVAGESISAVTGKRADGVARLAI